MRFIGLFLLFLLEGTLAQKLSSDKLGFALLQKESLYPFRVRQAVGEYSKVYGEAWESMMRGALASRRLDWPETFLPQDCEGVLAMTRDASARLWVLGQDGRIRIWRGSSLVQELALPWSWNKTWDMELGQGEENSPWLLEVSPSGLYLALYHRDQKCLGLWSWSSATWLNNYENIDLAPVEALRWEGDELLAYAANFLSCQRWTSKTGLSPSQPCSRQRKLLVPAASLDRQTLVYTADDAWLGLSLARDSVFGGEVWPQLAWSKSLAFRPTAWAVGDSAKVWALGFGHHELLWLGPWGLERRLRCDGAIRSLVLNASGDSLWVGDETGMVYLWVEPWSKSTDPRPKADVYGLLAWSDSFLYQALDEQRLGLWQRSDASFKGTLGGDSLTQILGLEAWGSANLLLHSLDALNRPCLTCYQGKQKQWHRCFEGQDPLSFIPKRLDDKAVFLALQQGFLSLDLKNGTELFKLPYPPNTRPWFGFGHNKPIMYSPEGQYFGLINLQTKGEAEEERSLVSFNLHQTRDKALILNLNSYSELELLGFIDERYFLLGQRSPVSVQPILYDIEGKIWYEFPECNQALLSPDRNWLLCDAFADDFFVFDLRQVQKPSISSRLNKKSFFANFPHRKQAPWLSILGFVAPRHFILQTNFNQMNLGFGPQTLALYEVEAGFLGFYADSILFSENQALEAGQLLWFDPQRPWPLRQANFWETWPQNLWLPPAMEVLDLDPRLDLWQRAWQTESLRPYLRRHLLRSARYDVLNQLEGLKTLGQAYLWPKGVGIYPIRGLSNGDLVHSSWQAQQALWSLQLYQPKTRQSKVLKQLKDFFMDWTSSEDGRFWLEPLPWAEGDSFAHQIWLLENDSLRPFSLFKLSFVPLERHFSEDGTYLFCTAPRFILIHELKTARTWQLDYPPQLQNPVFQHLQQGRFALLDSETNLIYAYDAASSASDFLSFELKEKLPFFPLPLWWQDQTFIWYEPLSKNLLRQSLPNGSPEALGLENVQTLIGIQAHALVYLAQDQVRVYRFSDGLRPWAFPLHLPSEQFLVSKDGQRLFSSLGYVYDLNQGQCLGRLALLQEAALVGHLFHLLPSGALHFQNHNFNQVIQFKN